MLGNAFDDGDPMLAANVKTDVIDADAHVVENERVWDYLEAGEEKFRPMLVADPDSPERQHWVLDGEDLGPKFPSPNEKQSEEHVKRFGREVGTPVQARELSDVTQRLRHMDALGIDVQVLYNSLWLRPLTRRPEVEIALCWSWNRWLADVWKLGENRLRWTCVVPALTPTEAAPQIRFAKEHGAVGVCVRPFGRGKLMTDPFYYPIYDEAERLDIPVTVHIANGNPELFKWLNNEAGGGFSTFRVPTLGPSCMGRRSRFRVLLLDFLAFCFVHTAQALLNSTPQLLARDRRAVAQGAQQSLEIFSKSQGKYESACDRVGRR